MVLLELKGLKRHYGLEKTLVRALDGIDLVVESGEVVLLLGPSGSGKTTLLNCLAAIDEPTEGEYEFLNSMVPRGAAEKMTTFRRENIGYIFQFFNLLPDLTALENVTLVQSLSGKRDPGRALDLLKLVGIEELADRFPAEMSGGQQQRVAIARSLSKEPKLLLGDELTGNLDSKTTQRVMEALVKACKKEDITAILVSHDRSLRRYATRIIELDSGIIASDEPGDASFVDKVKDLAEDASAAIKEMGSKAKRTVSGIATTIKDSLRIKGSSGGKED